MTLYDKVPKFNIFGVWTLDAVFVIIEGMKIALAYWAIHKFTKTSKPMSFFYAFVWDFLLISVRDIIWIFFADWVAFGFSTMTLEHIFAAYVRPLALLIVAIPFLRFRKEGYMKVGKMTKITIVIVAAFYISAILLGYPDFREPLTCKLITVDEAFIEHIISKAIWIPFAISLFYDAKHGKVKKFEQNTTIVRHAKVKNE